MCLCWRRGLCGRMPSREFGMHGVTSAWRGMACDPPPPNHPSKRRGCAPRCTLLGAPLNEQIMEDNPYDRRLESHAHASSQAAAANGDAIPAAEGRSRPRPGSGAGQVWVPPHRREGYQ